MKPRVRTAASSRPRRGASLVLSVILIFALMAVAALTVDLGTANLTQALMQDAADTAALEGHRWREYMSFQHPRDRRYEVNPIVGQVFDDDLLETEDDAMNFGAGPVFETHSSATGGLAIGTAPVFDPDPRYNFANWRIGDMVAGEFDPAGPHVEAPDYTRGDFTCVEDEDDGASGAFLVRLRRTGVPTGDDNISSKSQAGPGLPLLFGRGSAVRGAEPQTFDPRRHGLTVRATAIGVAQPALSVGIVPQATERVVPYKSREDDPLEPLNARIYSYPGVAPIALLDTFWTSWPAIAPFLPPTGETVIAVPDAPGQPQGRLRNAAGDVVGFFVQDLLQVGREVVHGPRPSGIDPEERMFLPVYRVVDGVKRVVGFGWAEMRPGSSPDSYVVVKRYSTVPVGGTSSSLVWPVDPLTEPVWSEILQANRELFSNDQSTSAALAPAIAR